MISIERRFLPLLAVAGSIVLMHQGLDLRSVTVGADVTTPTGRLGLVAILWSRGPALVAADLLLIVAAVGSKWTRVLGGLAFLHLVLGVAALADGWFFLADAGHMVGSIVLPQLASFRITVARLLAMLIAVGIGATVTGVSLFQAGRSRPGAG